MKIEELFEGANDNFLYHAMDIEKTLNVISKDEMEGQWKHYVGDKTLVGFSCSRNRNIWFSGEKCVRLTLDRNAIARRYRILPLDINAIQSRGRFLDRSLPMNEQLQEEFVLGSLAPLSAYTQGVELRLPRLGRDQSLYDLLPAIQAWADNHSILLKIDPALTAWREKNARRFG